ncbi:hypothetical protein LCGC14_2719010 [marine sediment metagenome]|uniref:Uncharacterized protein n=1 Tax=marine sediment metagenome TaxID=412755 RepID=A0A0F8ZY62_9ZZZZ
MTQQSKLAKVTCCRCGETFEYEDDGVTMGCMPDGAFLHFQENEWACSDCLEDGE